MIQFRKCLAEYRTNHTKYTENIFTIIKKQCTAEITRPKLITYCVYIYKWKTGNANKSKHIQAFNPRGGLAGCYHALTTNNSITNAPK